MNALFLFILVLGVFTYDIGYYDFNNIHVSKLRSSTNSIPTIGALNETTIRDICYNDKGWIVIDSHYKVYFSPITSPFVEISDDIPGGKPKKVVCTGSSFFILTFDNDLYGFGSGDYEELGSGVPYNYDAMITIGSGTDFLDIYAGKEAWYAVTTITDGNKREIWSGGKQTDGTNKGIPGPINLNNVFDVTESIPKIQIIDKGILLTYTIFFDSDTYHQYPNITHYFAGKFHPSKKVDVDILTKVDFREKVSDEIWNDHPLNWIARPTDKCGIITSQDVAPGNQGHNILRFGKICNTSFGDEVNYIELLSYTQYKDYTPAVSQITDLVCNDDCYITTQKRHPIYGNITYDIYGFGPSFKGTKLKYKINSICSNERMMITPKVGGTGYIYFENDFKRVHKDLIVNEYKPEITDIEMGADNTPGLFKINIRKPTTYFQCIPKIQMGATDREMCKFEGYSMWEFENENGLYDVYNAAVDWVLLNNGTNGCGWIKDDSTDDIYTLYDNTVFFEEKFFVKYKRTLILHDTEEYELPLRLKFQKEYLFNISVNTQKHPFDPFVAVFRKDIDEFYKKVDILLKIETDYPIILTLPELQFDRFDFTNHHNFTQLSVNEAIDELSCDPLHCYQTFHIQFYYLDCDLHTVITIHTGYNCTEGQSENPSCEVSDGYDYDIDVTIMAEDVCLIVEERVDATYDNYVYRDWERLELFDVNDDTEFFYVGDYVYFTFNISVEKIYLSNVYFEYIKIYDINNVEYPLYLHGITNPNSNFDQFTTDDGLKAGFKMDTSDFGETQSGADIDFMGWKLAFHLQLINEFVDLNFGDEGSVNVKAKIILEYIGNQRRSILFEKKSASHGTKNRFSVVGVKEGSNTIGTVVTVVSVTAGLTLLLALASIIFGVVYCMRKRNLKKDTELILKE